MSYTKDKLVLFFSPQKADVTDKPAANQSTVCIINSVACMQS